MMQIKQAFDYNFSQKRFIFALLFILTLYSCGAGLREDVQKKEYDGAVSKVFDLELIYSEMAERKVRLTAPLQIEFQNGNQDFPKGIKIYFYNEEGKNHATLTADKGQFFKKEDKYIATGNVVVKNIIKKETMKTEVLNWVPRDKTIFTEEFVTIQTPKEVLEGNGLKAAQDFTSYRITQPTGEFTVEEYKKREQTNSETKED